MDKRTFIKSLTGILGLSLSPLSILSKNSSSFDDFLTKDKKQYNDIWEKIRNDYLLNPDYINLESGYYCMLPQPILQNYWENVQRMNYLHTFYKRKLMAEDKTQIIKKLAKFLGCSTEEIIVTRNATESIDTILSGIDWKEGDEILYAVQEYPAMIAMIQQLAKRYRIKPVEIFIPFQPSSDEEIISLYQNKITSKTRLILVSHIINITGQVLPIKKICQMAHQHAIEVLVDGAHAIGHLDFKITDFDCNYYASSLHKWLSVPLGAGLLYVKTQHIPKIWPLLGDNEFPTHDIRKLNHTGTQPFAAQLTIPFAIDYLQQIGLKNKENRLKALKKRWYQKLWDLKNPKFEFFSPLEESRSCGIANIGIKNMKPSDLADILLKDYKIWTVAIDFAGVHGIRVTPNVYNTFEEMDALYDALVKIANQY